MRKSAKRFLSTILALTMLCSCMVIANVSTALAATSVYEFYYGSSTVNTSNYFSGTTTSTTANSASFSTLGGSSVSVSKGLKLNSGGYLQFTVTGTADLTLIWGGKNSGSTEYKVALTKDGTTIDTYSSTSNTVTTSTTAGLTAGTYKIARTSSESVAYYVGVSQTVSDSAVTYTVNGTSNVPSGTLSVNGSTVTTDENGNWTYTVSSENGAPFADGDELTVASSGYKSGTATLAATTDSTVFTASVSLTEIVIATSSGSSIDDLVAATTTTTYDLLATANAAGFTSSSENELPAYKPGKLYFDNQIYEYGSTGSSYYAAKTTYDLDGTKNNDGLRVRGATDAFALKLAANSTVSVSVYGGGSSTRYAYITDDTTKITTTYTSADDYLDSAATGDSSNQVNVTLSYTNDTTSDKVVYISATGDSFLSQIKVSVPGTYYAYFGITADEKANSESYSIKAGDTVLDEGCTVVYEGVTIGETSHSVQDLIDSGEIDSNSAYVVAYLVNLSAGKDISDLEIDFTAAATEETDAE